MGTTTTKFTPLKYINLGPTCVQGWIEKIHSLKKHSFLTLRDGVGSESRVQVFVPKTVADGLVVESYLEIEGVVRELPSTAHSFRPFEIEAQKVTVLGKSDSDFMGRCPPEAGQDIKLKERHLYLRSKHFSLVTKLRAILLTAIRNYFDSQDMTEISPAMFVGTECEGGATLFRLKHPGAAGHDSVDCFLTQSSQFYLEYALPGIGDCWCMAPSFRAEKSHTGRHMTEFTHLECEWRGILSLEDHIAKLKHMLTGIVKRFLMLGRPLLTEMGLVEHVEKLVRMCEESIVMTHREAIQYCRDHGIFKDEETQTHFDWMDDIPEMQERRMIDQIGKIVFLCLFPSIHKSFYMQPDPSQPEYAWGVDVELPGVGEVIGSGVRVSDEALLRQRLREFGLKEEDYTEYIDLRRYGHGATSGMGMGVDRLLMVLLDEETIRRVTTFPRFPGYLRP